MSCVDHWWMRRRNPYGLRVLEREEPWPDGTVVTWLESPFPFGRKPFVTGRLHDQKRRATIPLSSVIGTQKRVTLAGVERYLAHPEGGLPVIYRTHDGAFIADGHHRLAAAWIRGDKNVDVELVDVPTNHRENPSRPVTKRDAGLASVAKDKTLSSIGQWPWHQNERIERTQYEDIELYGEPQQVVLIWTSSENALGARKNGRLLIASNESANYIGAGAFFIEENGRKCIQSVWVEPEYRQSMRHVRTGEPPGVDFGSILADMAKRDGIVCILKPISKAGTAWAKRHGLQVRA